METAFHKLDHLAKELGELKEARDIFWEWVQHFDKRQEAVMANIEDLKAKLPALDEAVRQVGDYVQTLNAKVDEASQPHPAVQEMIDHVTGLTDALSRMVPREDATSAPEAAPEPALGQQEATETETPADVQAR